MSIAPLQSKINNFLVNYIHSQTMIEYCILKVTIKDFLKNVEKYGIRLLN